MKASEVLVHVVQKQQLGNTDEWVLHEVVCAAELGLSLLRTFGRVRVSVRSVTW